MKLIAQNFLGLQRVEWEPNGVCLVVGPNGSGKTSLLRAFSFLQAVFAASVPRAVTLLGGARGLKRLGAGNDEPVLLALEAADLRWELELIVQGGAVAEFPGERLYVGGELVVRRTPLSNEWSIETERITDRLEDEPLSCLRAAWERRGQPARWRPIIDAVRGSRIYDQKWSVPHLWEAALPSNTDLTLVPNGRNLFSVLRNWRAEPRRYGGQYEWVREKMRLAFYDIFDDLEIGTQDDRVSVQYFAPGRDEGLPVRRAADGLIVGLLHLTAVASARLRALVMLDEIENQLHPHAIRVILAAMRELAEERDLTVVLTTHSPVVMNEFKGDLERFFVTEPGRDRLPVRLDELHDPRYLAQFALGDLFERLKIGAPAPAQDSAAELADVRVALIPTGIMELLGLRDCLAGLFPNHDFKAVPSVPERPDVKAEPFSQSFTARHRADDAEVPTTLAKLIQELAGQVYPRRRDAADVAVVVDDLELFNLERFLRYLSLPGGGGPTV
jgi:predicted ATPase